MAEAFTSLPAVPQTEAWTSLSQLLPARNHDCDYWWKLTGGHLATMLHAAGYTLQRQYDALLFHYHWIVSPQWLVLQDLLVNE